MMPRRLPNGNFIVPKRAVSEDGVLGDGMAEIGPDDDEYWKWVDWLANHAPISDRERARYRNMKREKPPQSPPPL